MRFPSGIGQTEPNLWRTRRGFDPLWGAPRLRSIVRFAAAVFSCAVCTSGLGVQAAQRSAPMLVLRGHEDRVRSAVFSPDGTRIVTASADKTARVWDARTGAALLVLRHEYGYGVHTAVFSPDGARIVTTDYERARVWDAKTGVELLVLERKKYGGLIQSATFSADGRRIVTAEGESGARVWDARSGAELLHLKREPRRRTKPEVSGDYYYMRAEMEYAEFSPDGSRILIVLTEDTGEPRIPSVWNARTGTELLVLQESAVESAVFSPDGTRILIVSARNGGGHDVRILDSGSGRELFVSRKLDYLDYVHSAAFSPDGMLIVVAALTNTYVWNARTGAALLVLGRGDVTDENDMYSAAFSPDGTRIITTGDKTASVWDARTAPIAQVKPLPLKPLLAQLMEHPNDIDLRTRIH